MRRYPVPLQPDYFDVQKLVERGSDDDWFELCRRAAQEPSTRQALRAVVEEQARDLHLRWSPLLKWIDWRDHRIELQIAAITHLALCCPCEERPRLVEAMVDAVPRPDREAVARCVAVWLEQWEEWALAPTFRTARAQRADRVPTVLRDELRKDETLRKLWSTVRTGIRSRPDSVETAQQLMDHLTHLGAGELSQVHEAVLRSWPGRLGKRIVEGGDRWLDLTAGCPPSDLETAEGEAGIDEWTEKAKTEGALMEERCSVIVVLGVRFGSVPDRVRERIEAIEDQAALRQLLRSAVMAASLDAFAEALEGVVPGA